MAATILSLATMASAWSGYQSTRWSGESTKANRVATELHVESTQQNSVANRQMSAVLSIFANWFEAEVAGDERLAALIEERFRPEFAVAFRAWMARDPSEEIPSGSPFDMAEYVLDVSAGADRLVLRAQAETTRADEYKRRAEDFVLTAVLYASVLFFAGIASKMNSARASHLAVVLSGAMFLMATILMLSLPTTIGY